MEKLIENGCRHLAFLRAGTRIANEPNKRKDGFVSACEEQGIPYAMKVIDDGTPCSVFEEFPQEHMHGVRLFGDMDLPCSTIVQPLKGIARNCVNLVLDEHIEEIPSLICLPVSYAYGGTTRLSRIGYRHRTI